MGRTLIAQYENGEFSHWGVSENDIDGDIFINCPYIPLSIASLKNGLKKPKMECFETNFKTGPDYLRITKEVVNG